ncbi:MAG: amidohydrolase family protein [Chloroflexi bacterium]|nr:amidohydrolase family protein [Chloroflexota bacterium]
MIIDFHTHIFPPAIKEDRSDYVRRDPGFAALYSSNKARVITAEELVESMDQAGIDISVIANFAWASPGLCAETNDYILESVVRYPKRLAGFCAIPPGRFELAIAEIERCAHGGARGMGELRPENDLLAAGREDLAALSGVLQRHGLALMTHSTEPMGHLYPGKGNMTPDLLHLFITRFPGIAVICAHWGGGLPFYALMPEVKQTLGNVYFDTAASPFLYSPEVYACVSRLVGPEKVLFGSDYPLLPQRRIIDEISAADLPGEAKDLILSGNARKLLHLDEVVP